MEIILKEENCDKTVKLLECNSNFFPSGKIYIRVAPFVWRCKGQIGTKMTKYILEGEKYTAYYDEIKDYIKIELLLEEQ